MEFSQCSPTSNPSQGITANPEISGIGVRTAIYIQAALSLFYAIVAGYDGKIDEFELKSLVSIFLGILLPGCALLLSVIIQAKTFGLSAYHAMIVLFLSWINNTTALTFFAYVVGEQYYRPSQLVEESQKPNEGHDISDLDREWAEADVLGRWRVLEKVEKTLDKLNCDKNGTKSMSLKDLRELEIQKWSLWRKKKIMTMIPNQEDTPEFQRRWEEEWEENERKLREILPNPDQIEMLSNFNFNIARSNVVRSLSRKSILWSGALASAHLMLLSAFGLWFWSTLPNFGVNQECIPSIRFVFFTKSIPITSKVLRSRSKSIYIFSSLPGINIYIWLIIFLWASVAVSLAIGAVPIIVVLLIMVMKRVIGLRIERAPAGGAAYSRRYLTQFFFAITIITTLAVQTSLIALTELTIAHNQHLIQSKEDNWTFGQTLALMLTLIPLSEAIKFLWEKCPRAPKDSGNKDKERRDDRESGDDSENSRGREGREDREAELGADNSGPG